MEDGETCRRMQSLKYNKKQNSIQPQCMVHLAYGSGASASRSVPPESCCGNWLAPWQVCNKNLSRAVQRTQWHCEDRGMRSEGKDNSLQLFWFLGCLSSIYQPACMAKFLSTIFPLSNHSPETWAKDIFPFSTKKEHSSSTITFIMKNELQS